MNEININRIGVPDIIPSSDGRLTLIIPIKIRRRGSNKVVTLPNGEIGKPHTPHEPTAMQMALARGHRWLAMLESGEVKTLTEIAKREGVDNSYVSRMVNLTTLAPDIVAAILDDILPDTITQCIQGWVACRTTQNVRAIARSVGWIKAYRVLKLVGLPSGNVLAL